MVQCSFDREKESCTAGCYESGNRVSYCTISASREEGLLVFTISAWHTAEGSRRKGCGREVLAAALRAMVQHLGLPDEIRYNWNGTNQYVYGWLEKHFLPVCLLPIAEQKYAAEDNKLGHIYRLDRAAVLEYIRIEEGTNGEEQ